MAQPSKRQCPLCEPSPTYEAICPFHAVPTVDIEIFDLPVGSALPGAIVAGRYKVERALESGGMGTVLIAKQIGVNRTVALKVLRPDRPVDLPLLRRFYNEAHAISSLSHPNIVQVFDFGFDAELRVPYLAMEYVEGSTLDRMLDAGPLGEKRTAKLLAQVARALVEAHAAGIVHRDLKPANVMVVRLRDGEEHVKVLDFGVAKIVRTERDGLTAPGMTLGSPHYMSPEQARAEAIDGRADLYSLGCVMYELLTAQAPFDAQATLEVMSKQVHAPRPPLPERLIADKKPPTEATRALYDALLAKRREDRPGTASTVARIFSAIAQGAPIDVRRTLEDERTDRTFVRPDPTEPEPELTAATMPFYKPGAATPQTPAGAASLAGRSDADRMRILNAATAVPAPEMKISAPALSMTVPRVIDEVSTDKSVPTFPQNSAGLHELETPFARTAISARTPGGPAIAPVTTPVAAQVAPPPARSAKLTVLATIAVVALMGAAIASVVWSKSGTPESAPIAHADAAVVAEVVPRVQAERVAAVTPVDAGVVSEAPVLKKRPAVKAIEAPAAAVGKEVRIVTEPGGASVLKNGVEVGLTPLGLKVSRGESVNLVLKKQGFIERKIVVGEDSPASLKIDLVPVW